MNTPNQIKRARGFSIVELMVSVVIGLVAVMFATKLMVKSETEKSGALGTSDQMQNGMLAMFSISTDAAQAGYGLNDDLVNGCNMVMTDHDGYTMPKVDIAGAISTPLSGVVLVNHGERSDEISIFAGSGMGAVGNVKLAAPYVPGAQELVVASNDPFGFNAGDVMLVVSEPIGSDCSLVQLAQTPVNTARLNIGLGTDLRFNTGAGLTTAYSQGNARIYNLGRPDKLAFHTWSVKDGVLQLRATDLDGTSRTPQAVVGNVVAIKAQYGVDDNAWPDNNFEPRKGVTITKWSNEMFDVNKDGVINALDYQRVTAMRLAVIARSGVAEKPAPGASTCTATTAPLKVFTTTEPATATPVSASVKLDVPGDTSDWTCYRYRAFETIVPVRNSMWRP